MSDGKNTEQVQGFFIKQLTTPALYIGFCVGVIATYLFARFVGV